MQSLEKQISQHFKEGNSLTVVETLQLFQTIELRKIVSTLRRQGMEIKDEWMESSKGKRYKRYFLFKKPEYGANGQGVIFHEDN